MIHFMMTIGLMARTVSGLRHYAWAVEGGSGRAPAPAGMVTHDVSNRVSGGQAGNP